MPGGLEKAVFYGIYPQSFYDSNGDEIAMQPIEGLGSKEGGIARTGSRTPMQWEPGPNSRLNLSCSACARCCSRR